jgi:hypothetical protein
VARLEISGIRQFATEISRIATQCPQLTSRRWVVYLKGNSNDLLHLDEKLFQALTD